jgi:DNA-binding transcriptional LysR family regulator
MLRLNQIDLNLLVALDTLLDERHVTRAARRLGVTQSAMSQTLQRLRETFDDPLLVRQGGRMVATPRAIALVGPLRAALHGLEAVLAEPEAFDPARDVQTFRVAAFDFYTTRLFPPLFDALAHAGPQLRVECQALDVDRIDDQLRNGTVDVAIIARPEQQSDMRSQPLFEESMSVIARRGHPALAGVLDCETYCRWPHAVFRIAGRGTHLIDDRLAERGLSRRIVGRTPYFLSAPWLASMGDLLVSVPTSLARSAAAHWPIDMRPHPLGPMGFTVSMRWPAFLDGDQPQRWFRGLLAEIAGTAP